MAKKDHVSETPATALLKAHKVAFTEHPYEYLEHGGAQHSAQVLGWDPFTVVKTLIMQDQDARPLVVLMHGNRKVSTKNLARQIGAKSVEPCKPEVANRHSGYLVGGTSPFGTRRDDAGVHRGDHSGAAADPDQRRAARLSGGHRPAGLRAAAGRASRCSARWQNSGLCDAGTMARWPSEELFGIPLSRSSPPWPLTWSGSLSFAVIVSRVMGLNDPRTYGSKNPGATNVLRSGTKAAAIVTLLLDAAKGWLPVVLVSWFGKPYGLDDGTVALVGLAAFLGHLYPVFFRFEGGKGVATALGVLFGISWLLGLATALTWLIIAFFFRYSSLASLVAAVFAPVYYLFGDRRGLVRGQVDHAGHLRDGHVAGLAPPREHQPPAGGQGIASWGRRKMSELRRLHRRRPATARRPSSTGWLPGRHGARVRRDRHRGADGRRAGPGGPSPGRVRQRPTRILRAQIFLADIADIGAMNAVWDAWVVPGTAPPRATVQAALADPAWRIEIVVTAAVALISPDLIARCDHPTLGSGQKDLKLAQ